MTSLDLAMLHQQGKLEQVCPTCGLRETAGGYCTSCLTVTGSGHWRESVRSEAQQAASRAVGQFRGARGTRKGKTANPEVVA